MYHIPAPLFISTFVFGLLIGSFLNVCIYRIPLGLSVVMGRSYCPTCGHLIPWYYNVPLISYLALLGHCRYCKTFISPIYPAVELLNALLYVAVVLIYGYRIETLLIIALFSLLIVISFIDLRHMIIPDGLVAILFGLGVISAGYQIFVVGQSWVPWVVGLFAASLPLWALGLLFEDGIGGGDIKFMAAAGVFVGWKLILLTLFLGALFALGYAGVLFAKGRVNRRAEVPFGPFLSLGLTNAILFGENFLTWYFNLF